MNIQAETFSYEKIKAMELSRLQCFLGLFAAINGILFFLEKDSLQSMPGWIRVTIALVIIALGCRMISLAFFPLKVVEHK